MHPKPARKAPRVLAGALLAITTGTLARPAQAVEYGLGDYLLGYSIPMSGYTPPPGIYYQNTFHIYNGSASANRNFPVGNVTTAGLEYNIMLNITTVAWYTDATVFGGTLGFAATIPVGRDRTLAEAAFRGPLGRELRLHDDESVVSIGDTAYTASLGWHAGEHHWNLSVTGFAPTGYYNPDSLAITSFNRPAIDIKGAYTFLSLQTGLELTIAPGVTINAINNQTNYQSGAELHLEYAATQHLPGGLYAGAGGYFYQQFTGDVSPIAIVGPFKGRVASIGPVVGYTFKVGQQEINLAGRWFHEFAAKNRVRGDAIFASLSFRL